MWSTNRFHPVAPVLNEFFRRRGEASRRLLQAGEQVTIAKGWQMSPRISQVAERPGVRLWCVVLELGFVSSEIAEVRPDGEGRCTDLFMTFASALSI
jgi:hypothetical protein